MHRSFRNYLVAIISSLFLLQAICQALVIHPDRSPRLFKRMQPYRYATQVAKFSNNDHLATSQSSAYSRYGPEMDFSEIFESSDPNPEMRSYEGTSQYGSGVNYRAIESGGKESTQPYRYATNEAAKFSKVDDTTSRYLPAMPSRKSEKLASSQYGPEMDFRETFEPSDPGRMRTLDSSLEAQVDVSERTRRVESRIKDSDDSRARAFFQNRWRQQG